MEGLVGKGSRREITTPAGPPLANAAAIGYVGRHTGYALITHEFPMSPLPGLLMAVALLGGCPQLSPTDPKVTDLIRQLGHMSYAPRETAAKALTSRGLEVIPALTLGRLSPDQQVAGRCEQLIPLVIAVDRNEKMARLLKEPAGPIPKDFGGAERFLKITGDTREARLLFAEMMNACPQTLEALDRNPNSAGKLLEEFCHDCREWHYGSAVRTVLPDQARVAMFLFLGADKRIPVNIVMIRTTMLMMESSVFFKSLSEPTLTPAVKKLFLNRVDHERINRLFDRAVLLVAKKGMKEITPALLKMISNEKDFARHNANNLIVLLNVGSREHIKNVEPFLSDKTLIGYMSARDIVKAPIQARDLALGVCVLLSGQKLADYGYHFAKHEDDDSQDMIIYYSFRDDATRNKAFAKWKAWREKDGAGK